MSLLRIVDFSLAFLVVTFFLQSVDRVLCRPKKRTLATLAVWFVAKPNAFVARVVSELIHGLLATVLFLAGLGVSIATLANGVSRNLDAVRPSGFGDIVFVNAFVFAIEGLPVACSCLGLWRMAAAIRIFGGLAQLAKGEDAPFADL